jgi:WD40 repeat protein
MKGLRLDMVGSGEGHGGEVLACSYTADGAFVLSGGWDGHLRLWLVSTGKTVTSLTTGPKPLASCALSPDGKIWVSGSMDGFMAFWDTITHQLKQNFIGHIRPISAIQYSPDGQLIATASWDRKLMLRKLGKERDGTMLSGHHDIVSGCCFTPDGRQLLSWSHDGTLRLWDVNLAREQAVLAGHPDRVTSACLSRDGNYAISGGRDGSVKLWDLQQLREVRSLQLNGEVRACFGLLDGDTVATVTADGWLVLWSLPDFEVQTEFDSGVKTMCAALAPSGSQIALGGENGFIHFVAIDGTDQAPLFVTPTQTTRLQAGNVFDRLLGKQKMLRAYQYTCPACQRAGEVVKFPDEDLRCGGCKRLLRLNRKAVQLQEQ